MILQSTKYSTFSIIASLISQKPLINLCDQINGNLIYAWKPCLNITINDEIFDHVINEDELKEATNEYHRISLE